MTHQSEAANLLALLAHDFPHDAATLHSLCLNDAGFPVGYYHPDHLADLANVALPPTVIDSLRSAYVPILAYYFLLDDVVDRDITDDAQPLYLTHLLASGVTTLTRTLYRFLPTRASEFSSLFYQYISDNAAAIRSESDFRRNALVPAAFAEYENITGRANFFTFLYILICGLGNVVPHEQTVKIIKDFLFFMQLGDDLGDWRIDFQAQRWTSFLRASFRQMNKIPQDEAELEHFVYFSGAYEVRLAYVIRGFDALIAQVERAPRFAGFIGKQRRESMSVLRDFIAAKVQHGYL